MSSTLFLRPLPYDERRTGNRTRDQDSTRRVNFASVCFFLLMSQSRSGWMFRPMLVTLKSCFLFFRFLTPSALHVLCAGQVLWPSSIRRTRKGKPVTRECKFNVTNIGVNIHPDLLCDIS